MTSVLNGRDERRRDLAAALDRDPALLSDQARLDEDLALDSLDMLNLLTWLESAGVTNTDHRALRRIGQVLDLAGSVAGRPGVSIVVGPGAAPRFGDRRDSLAPVLHDPSYLLTPIQEADLPFLYTLATHPETSYRWRYRGNPPPLDRFAADLWQGVMVQLVARTAAAGKPEGLLVAYQADLMAGHAMIGAVFSPEHAGTGLPAKATSTFVRYLFHTFSLRKLYLEIPGYNWDQVAGGAGRQFVVEGVLREHDFYAGRYWDKRLCAIYRPGEPAARSAARAT